MKSYREEFHDFLTDIGLRGSLDVQSAQSSETDPKLRYALIEKFRVSMLTKDELKSIILYSEENELGLYFAFGNLCIGFPERKLHHRLDVF